MSWTAGCRCAGAAPGCSMLLPLSEAATLFLLNWTACYTGTALLLPAIQSLPAPAPATAMLLPAPAPATACYCQGSARPGLLPA